MVYPDIMRDSESATAAFYETPRGAMAAQILCAQIKKFWPDLTGSNVLGLGWTAPYLPLWHSQAQRLIEAIPHDFADGSGCIVAEDRLPFTDLLFDRVLLIHAIEQADDAARLLREVWRVLRDDGRILVITPNRLGFWAHAESTPFGHGQPFSPGQITRLLQRSAFATVRREQALYVPPLKMRRAAEMFERVGRLLTPQLAGVTVIEAEKDAYAGMPLGAAERRRVIVAQTA